MDIYAKVLKAAASERLSFNVSNVTAFPFLNANICLHWNFLIQISLNFIWGLF